MSNSSGFLASSFAFVVIVLSVSGCSDSSVSSTPSTESTDDKSLPPCFILIAADIKSQDRISVILHVDGAAEFDLREILESVELETLLSLHLVDEPSQIDESTAEQRAPESPSIFGKYYIEQHNIRFMPSFPLLRGETYVAVFRPASTPQLAEYEFKELTKLYTVPRGTSVAAPTVESIFPSASVVPANHLKFYLNFSEPMQRGDIFKYFSLVDLTTSQEVPRPFRHTELWSSDNRRLTLWFHPGRQKTGVNLNVEIGPVLNVDHEYRLVISKAWKSERGEQLKVDVTKDFAAGSQDAIQPNPKAWKLNAPAYGTREPLKCELDESLDWALLHSAFTVERIDDGVTAISGLIEVSKNETIWSFKPQSSWSAGKYRLAVQNIVEDLAGNNLNQPFEVDVSQKKPSDSTSKSHDAGSTFLEFTVSAARSQESE